MGRLVFADSSGLVGFLVAADPYHGPAVDAVKEILRAGSAFVTSNYIFDEAITLVRRSEGHREARRVGEAILGSRVIKRLYVDEIVEAEAWRLFLKYDDQELSFTDCTSFVFMEQNGIREAFTFDGDFRKVGFTALPQRRK